MNNHYVGKLNISCVYESELTGVLLEIDEKPALPNNVMISTVQTVFLNCQTKVTIS